VRSSARELGSQADRCCMRIKFICGVSAECDALFLCSCCCCCCSYLWTVLDECCSCCSLSETRSLSLYYSKSDLPLPRVVVVLSPRPRLVRSSTTTCRLTARGKTTILGSAPLATILVLHGRYSLGPWRLLWLCSVSHEVRLVDVDPSSW
jgi:hypothetical protein